MHAASHRLGAIERGVGAGEKLLGVLTVLRGERDADARIRMQPAAEHIVRPADVLHEPPREVVGHILAVDADLQDRELVAAEASDDVAGAQAGFEAVGHALQKAVADLVPVAVVHLLEVVEIDPVQRKALARVVALELPLEALAEVDSGSGSR